MALIPAETYPDQVDTDDPSYPHGKARNLGVEGDNTGTPFEETWLNDLWGFLQALLAAANLTPAGVPDNAQASQYLGALNLLYSPVEVVVTESGELAVPSWATHMELTVVGGGAGGGKGMSNGTGGDGAGGGGSGYLARTTVAVADLVSSPLVITIGAGGAGSATEGDPGADGGETIIADDSDLVLLRAAGGQGGDGQAAGDGYSGGGGGGDATGDGDGGDGGSHGADGEASTGTSPGSGGSGVPVYLQGTGGAGGAGGSHASGSGVGGGGGGGGGGPLLGGPGGSAGINSGSMGTSVGGAGGKGYGAGGGGGAGGAIGSPGAGGSGGAGAKGVAKVRFFRVGS